MNLNDLMDNVNDLAIDFIDTMKLVNAEKLGLDHRCGMLFVGEDCIAVESNNKNSLDYYGGFEYVHKEYVFTVGCFTFYYAEDSRVLEHIEQYNESLQLA